jgi:protein required for attachment to host cells
MRFAIEQVWGTRVALIARMNTVWILVCDSARGRLFETQGNDPSWKLLQVLTHGESREKTNELVSDHSGQKSSQGASAHHNALAPASSPKEVEKGHFVHALATMLDQGMRSKQFDRLALVAPPHFLGMLKKELTSELQKHLMVSVDKDLTSCDTADLMVRLHDSVRIPLDEKSVVGEGHKHAH